MNAELAVDLTFVRHGQAVGNPEGQVLGGETLLVPLTQTGEDQARDLITVFAGQEFDAFYSSKAIRSRRTMDPLAMSQNQTVTEDPLLLERLWNGFNHMTVAEIEAAIPDVVAQLNLPFSTFSNEQRMQLRYTENMQQQEQQTQ